MPSPVTDLEADLARHRYELVAHCYRLLGSVHEAEDAVQETMLRAWRARDRYDPAVASVRTWLYAIATNACLTALSGRARRALPAGLGAASEDPRAPLTPAFDVPWLQPFPDTRLAAEYADPAATAVRRGSLRLALVAAIQRLPPRQRAVFVLREVLEFPAAEVASMVDTSVAAVNSALQRARSHLAGPALTEAAVVEPDDRGVRELVEKYVRAFEAADVPGIVALLTADAVLEMPPVPLWYQGSVYYGQFMDRVFALRGRRWRMVPTSANGQPAAVAYCWDGAAYARHTLQVFAVSGSRVAHTVVFQDPRVFELFGVGEVLPGV